MSLVADAVEPTTAPKGVPVLEAKRLVKTFGKVVGLDGVSLQLHAGELPAQRFGTEVVIAHARAA